MCAFDAQGRGLLRQKETIGVAFRLEERGVLVGLLGERSDAPVELTLPAGAARVRLISQNYDSRCNPRRDGRVLVYDARGAIIGDESGVPLDILAP